MQRASSTNRSAFTLLELIAVMVLLGLISTIAMLTVTGQIEQTELVRVAQQIANADRKEREATRLSPFPGGLTFEANKQRLQFICLRQTIELGNRVKIADFIVNQLQSSGSQLLFTQTGQSHTYAVRLENKRGVSKWLLIVGMTGQAVFSDSTDEIRRLLAMGS